MRTQGRLTRIRGKLNLPWGMFNPQRVPINPQRVPINLYRVRTNPVWGSNEIEWGRDVLASAFFVFLYAESAPSCATAFRNRCTIAPAGSMAWMPATLLPAWR
jgi:hypothetical protein